MGRKGVFCLTARLEFTIRIILITLLFVCGVMANSLILSDFETIEDLQRWQVWESTPPSSLERVKNMQLKENIQKVLCPQISRAKMASNDSFGCLLSYELV